MERRCQPEKDRRQNCESDCEGHHPVIQAEVEPWDDQLDDVPETPSHGQAEDRGGKRQNRTFGEQLTNDPASAGSEGQAEADLPPSV